MVSKTIDRLISKYGSRESIPREVLENKGLVLFKGKIRSIANLSEKQLVEALGIKEFESETTEGMLETRIREIENEILQVSPTLQKKAPVFAKRIIEGNKKLEKLNYGSSLDETDNETKLYDNLPIIEFARFANGILENKNAPYIDGALNAMLDELLLLDDSEQINTDLEELFESTEQEYLLNEAREFLNSKKFNPQLKEEFKQKYGSLPLGETPFLSWAFKKQIFGEHDPNDFYGKSLLELNNSFVANSKNPATATEFAKFAYLEENSNFVEYFKSAIDTDISKYLSKFITDYVPQSIKKFEETRGKKGSAIAYLEEVFPDWDNPYEEYHKKLRMILEKIHLEEFPNIADSPMGKKYASLDLHVKNKSKKLKIIALCEQSDDFKELVDACANGQHQSYISNLSKNKLINFELEALGIATQTFYSGIQPLELLVSKGISVDMEKIKQEKLELYRANLVELFSNDVIRSKSKLEAKILSELKEEKIKNPLIESDFSKYLIGLTDEETIRKVCKISIEYLSRKQNVTDLIKANTIRFHLAEVNLLMKGSYKSKSDDENKMSSVYSIKLASKNPFTDVDIGNDGGCCIGIYNDGKEDNGFGDGRTSHFVNYLKRLSGHAVAQTETGNGQYMPFYLKDRATQFVEIYKENERVGMALMFAGQNETTNESCLIVNSIELSQKLKEDSNKDIIIGNTIDYIKKYASESGFKHVVMSDHHYNPAAKSGKEKVEFSVRKIHPWKDSFYSDNLNEDGSSDGSIWKTI